MAKRSIDQLDVRISEEQAKLEQNSRLVRIFFNKYRRVFLTPFHSLILAEPSAKRVRDILKNSKNKWPN